MILIQIALVFLLMFCVLGGSCFLLFLIIGAKDGWKIEKEEDKRKISLYALCFFGCLILFPLSWNIF